MHDPHITRTPPARHLSATCTPPARPLHTTAHHLHTTPGGGQMWRAGGVRWCAARLKMWAKSVGAPTDPHLPGNQICKLGAIGVSFTNPSSPTYRFDNLQSVSKLTDSNLLTARRPYQFLSRRGLFVIFGFLSRTPLTVHFYFLS